MVDTMDAEEVYQSLNRKIGELPYDWEVYYDPPCGPYRAHLRVPDSRKFLLRLGITREVLDKLSVIHVTGSKGKGSTSAMTERILRNCGYKTGLLTSPPLIETRERVRIGGCVLSRALFAKYGQECFDLVKNNTHVNADDPPFANAPGPYSFYTILAFYIFIQEKVDVAVIEVGMGGENDGTNSIWTPTVCAVTSLALEHINELGNTIEKIAWHKSGIFKEGRPAYTVTGQPEKPLQELARRAKERGATLKLCPRLDQHDTHGRPLKIGLYGEHQAINASLAVMLAKKWIQEKDPSRFTFQDVPVSGKNQNINGVTAGKVEVDSPFVLPDEFIDGIADVHWPGRNQIVRTEHVTYYLDNAHTVASVLACKEWFEKESRKERDDLMQGPQGKKEVKKILVFTLAGNRDPVSILPPLVDYGFDAALFTVKRMVASDENEVRDWKVFVSLEDYLKKCTYCRDTFIRLQQAKRLTGATNGDDNITEIDSGTTNGQIGTTNGYNGTTNGEIGTTNGENSTTNGHSGSQMESAEKPIELEVLPSATDALQWIADAISGKANNLPSDAVHAQVLVTGSTYLVGSVLGVLDPLKALNLC